MPKNSLYSLYIVLWLLIQLLNSQIALFKPIQRYLHTATHINNKLYIIGGLEQGKEFLYLDMSFSFDTQNKLSWHNLTRNNIVPNHYDATSIKGGGNNHTLFLFGGLSFNGRKMALVYTYDTLTDSWSISNITEGNIIRKFSLKGIAGYNGNMYFFGGSLRNKTVNDMLILDTTHLNWEFGSQVNAPTPRVWYGATLLPSQHIIYLGE